MPLECMSLWLECCKTCLDFQAGLPNFFNAEYLSVFKVSLPITPLLVPVSAVTMEYVSYTACTVNCRFDCIWHEWHITCCLHLLYCDRIMSFSIELLLLVLEIIWNNHRVSRTILYHKFIFAEGVSILKFIAGWLCNSQAKWSVFPSGCLIGFCTSENIRSPLFRAQEQVHCLCVVTIKSKVLHKSWATKFCSGT